MPISVKCCDCGRALKAPESLAGKKAKCPDCGAVVVVPDTKDEIATNGARPKTNIVELAEDRAAVTSDEISPRKLCPMCGEIIAAAAVKCRFCGETLSSSVRSRERQRTRIALDNQLTASDIAICVCFPIGCVVGIVAMIAGQPARGLKMVGLALVMPFLWGAIASIFR